MEKRQRPEWPLQRLKGMYFAMHCWKCKKFELPQEEYEQRCEQNIQRIIENIKLKKMTFKEFNGIIKNSSFCQFEKREFSDCPICKKLGSREKEYSLKKHKVYI